MARSDRFIRLAYNVSQEADSNCSFLLGAVIVLGSRVISTGACTTKTHPRNPKTKATTLKDQLCAEIVAILRAIKILSAAKIKDCNIYVTRRRKNGTKALAKPCEHCQGFLKEIGIRSVFYTTNAGKIEHMELPEFP